MVLPLLAGLDCGDTLREGVFLLAGAVALLPVGRVVLGRAAGLVVLGRVVAGLVVERGGVTPVGRVVGRGATLVGLRVVGAPTFLPLVGDVGRTACPVPLVPRVLERTVPGLRVWPEVEERIPSTERVPSRVPARTPDELEVPLVAANAPRVVEILPSALREIAVGPEVLTPEREVRTFI